MVSEKCQSGFGALHRAEAGLIRVMTLSSGRHREILLRYSSSFGPEQSTENSQHLILLKCLEHRIPVTGSLSLYLDGSLAFSMVTHSFSLPY